MAYLGRGLDKISNIEVLDNITFDGSSSYSITKGSVAFTPNSAQSCLISIDGVVQATNFTVSSSTIDFGVAIPSTSTCNFFLHYGTGVMTVPSDGSVTTAKLGNSAVDLTSKVTGALPVANGGTNLTSGFANGITAATTFRLNASSTNSNSNADITANWEVVDTPDYSTLGSAVSQSSGIFSFPSTGYWLALCHFYVAMNNDGSCNVFLKITTDNSTYTTRAYNSSGASGAQNGTVAYNTVIDVTNTTNVKCKFATGSFSSAYIYGETAATTSGVTFIRLGDT